MKEGSGDRRAFLRSTMLGAGAVGGAALLGSARPAEGSSVAAPELPSVEARLRELGIRLLEPEPQQAAIVPAVQVGRLLFVSGNGPRKEDGTFWVGKVGATLTADEAIGIDAIMREVRRMRVDRVHLISDRYIVTCPLQPAGQTPSFSGVPQVNSQIG